MLSLHRRTPSGISVLVLALLVLLLSGRAVIAKHHLDNRSFGDLYKSSRAVVDDGLDVVEPAVLAHLILDLAPRDTGRFEVPLPLALPPAGLTFARVSPPRGPPASRA